MQEAVSFIVRSNNFPSITPPLGAQLTMSPVPTSARVPLIRQMFQRYPISEFPITPHKVRPLPQKFGVLNEKFSNTVRPMNPLSINKTG